MNGGRSQVMTQNNNVNSAQNNNPAQKLLQGATAAIAGPLGQQQQQPLAAATAVKDALTKFDQKVKDGILTWQQNVQQGLTALGDAAAKITNPGKAGNQQQQQGYVSVTPVLQQQQQPYGTVQYFNQ